MMTTPTTARSKDRSDERARIIRQKVRAITRRSSVIARIRSIHELSKHASTDRDCSSVSFSRVGGIWTMYGLISPRKTMLR